MSRRKHHREKPASGGARPAVAEVAEVASEPAAGIAGEAEPEPAAEPAALADDAGSGVQAEGSEDPGDRTEVRPREATVAGGPMDVLFDYERRAAEHVAGAAEQVEAPGLWRGIGFRLGERLLLSGIHEVNEILQIPPLTLVPGTKPWLLGVANVRGNLVAVVDLRGYLEGGRSTIGERSRLLLARQPGGTVGLLVDEVLGQRNLTDENVPLEEGEDDERYEPFVPGRYDLGGTVWGIFRMTTLVKMPDFVQAAA